MIAARMRMSSTASPLRSRTWNKPASPSGMPLRPPDRVDHPRRPFGGRDVVRSNDVRTLPHRMRRDRQAPLQALAHGKVEGGADERLAGRPDHDRTSYAPQRGQLAEDPKVPRSRFSEA